MRGKKFRSRRDEVCDFVRKATAEGLAGPEPFSGVGAIAISSALGLDRANVSKELNALYRGGQMIKALGKPTLYLHRAVVTQRYPGVFIPATIPKDATLAQFVQQAPPSGPVVLTQRTSGLDSQIGASGSLRNAVSLAKAAVCYPPNGLHMLLSGKAGCGKMHFVRMIYEYAVSKGVLQENAPLVVHDCQDGTSSLQALESKIFGHASSQAGGRSRRGLLELASGGILCLEGAEHLPVIIQNQLAAFFKENTFKRFGESTISRQGNVIVVLVTTDPVDSSQIARLAQSAPVHIAIPDLDARSLDELFSYISLFFHQEAARIGTIFHVEKGVLAALLCKTYRGNVAQLQSTIKVICALAVAATSSGQGAEVVLVTVDHLPPDVFREDESALPISLQAEAILRRIPMDHVAFSSRFPPPAASPSFSAEPVQNSEERSAPLLVLATYGDGIAQRQAELINSITGKESAVGISFALTASLDSILTTLLDFLQQTDYENGMFLATDIAPLFRMEGYIQKQTGRPLSLLSDLRLPTLLTACGGSAAADSSLSDRPTELAPQSDLLDGANASSFLDRIVNEVLAPTLTFLDPRKAASILLDTLNRILSDLDFPYNDEIAVKFVFHCSHMLERLIRGNSYKYERLRIFMNQNGQIYTCVERRLLYVAEIFGISIPATEIAYVAELFTR